MRIALGTSAVLFLIAASFLNERPMDNIAENMPACIAGVAESGPGVYTVDVLKGNVITTIEVDGLGKLPGIERCA